MEAFRNLELKNLYTFEGLGKMKVEEAIACGDICAIMGIDGFEIGDTIADFENPEGLTPINIDEPTMSMLFCYQQLTLSLVKKANLLLHVTCAIVCLKRLEKNLALRVEETDAADSYLSIWTRYSALIYFN
jgi:GTP-binding protein